MPLQAQDFFLIFGAASFRQKALKVMCIIMPLANLDLVIFV